MSIDPFIYSDVAKEVIGNLTDAIKATPRDTSVPEPQGRATFNTALLLQAGLRALLPVGEREGIALPRIFPNDAQELQNAQRNYAAVFESGKGATPEQGEVAFKAIELAAKQLDEQGYKTAAAVVNKFLKAHAATRPQALRNSGTQNDRAPQ